MQRAEVSSVAGVAPVPDEVPVHNPRVDLVAEWHGAPLGAWVRQLVVDPNVPVGHRLDVRNIDVATDLGAMVELVAGHPWAFEVSRREEVRHSIQRIPVRDDTGPPDGSA